MATREELFTALRNADASGDTVGAAKLAAYIKSMPAPQSSAASDQTATAAPTTTLESIKQGAGNLLAGALRGAGSIGATLLAPIDMAKDAINGKGLSLESNRQRRADMDAALQTMGAEPESALFKLGKLGSEVAGTAGAGGAVANGMRAVPVLAKSSPALIDAVGSAGLSGGGNALTRATGAAVNGASTAGLVDPESAGTGAIVGGALPGVVKAAGVAGNALSDAANGVSKKLMQSAIKPTIAQLRTGEADTAVQTLLDYGISPTKEGVEKLRSLIDEKNSAIADAIKSSNATVSKNKILQALGDVRSKFGNQVSPTADLDSIDKVANDFASHPSLPTDSIPVQTAQDLKQGTYSVLSKKYGQLGSAETEAQKGLARGLKEEIASAVPEVGALNAEESRLIKTLGVTERRALMELNKNPVGLTALAHNPIAAAGFMADRSAAFKAMAARMINRAADGSKAGQALIGAAQNPLLRAGGLVATEANP
jgi:hypothetical protein